MNPYDYEAAVRKFHEAMGVSCATAPTVADEATRVLRCKLLLEEVLEFIDASKCVLEIGPGTLMTVEPKADATPNLAEMAHELADVLYVAHDANLTFGFPGAEVMAEVHAANMRKLDSSGRPVRRADGKIGKPEGWKPADVAKVLATHGRKHED